MDPSILGQLANHAERAAEAAKPYLEGGVDVARGVGVLASAWKAVRGVFSGGSGKVQTEAQTRADQMTEETAKQLAAFQAEDPSVKAKVEANADEPDAVAAAKEALVAAARTPSSDKHLLLGRAVASRLCAESESLLAIASDMAIELVPKLTTKQLDLLGTLATVWYVRPLNLAVVPEAFAQWYERFLTRRLGVTLVGEAAPPSDYQHLDGCGCIAWESMIGRDLPTALAHREAPYDGYQWSADAFLATPIGARLSDWWNHMQHSDLLPLGKLVGTYVTDVKLGVRTTIQAL